LLSKRHTEAGGVVVLGICFVLSQLSV
jgi:hypothetical protein